MNRRHFVATAAMAGLAVGSRPFLKAQSQPAASPLKLHIFSKQLQFLDLEEMAAKAVEIGFEGVDLTVRPGGHVPPERARELLPRAAKALRANGIEPNLCTTAFSSVDDPFFDETLGALADAGFQKLRLGWHKYPKNITPVETIESLKPVASSLATSLERHGLQGMFQNHSGYHYVGSTVWELWQVLEEIDPKWLGLQFDVRHAAVERGLSWPNELAVAAPKIATIVLKDYKWIEDPKNGRGKVINVPMGEGWVNFPWYFKLLTERYQIDVPASLHLEHPLGGAEHGKREISIPQESVYRAMRQDIERAKQFYREAPMA